MIWRRFKLGEICEFKYGIGLKKSSRILGQYPVYGSGGLVGYHNDFFTKGPCIIVGRKGSIGTVYYEEKSCCPIDTVFYIEPKPTEYDLKFLYYYLTTLSLDRLNTDAAVPGLNRNVAYSQEISIPDLITQKKIASILSAYDDLIENNTRRIKILEELAQSIYKEWFVNFRFPGHEKVKFVDLPAGKAGSPLGKLPTGKTGIPEGWGVVELKDFGEIVTGKTPSTKIESYFGNDIPFIKTPDMHSRIYVINTIQCLSEEGAESQKKKYIPPNCICVSCIGTVGVVSITSELSQTNQQINSIILFESKVLEYLYFTCAGLKKTLLAYGINGATMANVNKEKFSAMKVLKPENNILTEYHQIANPIFEEIKNLLYKNQNLRKTRDLLLPKLMSGEVPVSAEVSQGKEV